MKISAEEKRTLIIGTVFFTLILLVRFFLIPMTDKWHKLGYRAEELNGRIKKAQAIIADKEKYSTRLEEARHSLISSYSYFFIGDEIYPASLDMLDRIDTLASASGLEVESKGIDVPDYGGNIPIIRVFFNIKGYPEEVYDFLRRLELADKVYIVKFLDLRNSGDGVLKGSVRICSLFFASSDVLLGDIAVKDGIRGLSSEMFAIRYANFQEPTSWHMFNVKVGPSDIPQRIPFEVNGIVHSTTSQAALLTDKDKEFLYVVKPGDNIGGMKVLKISEKQLIIEVADEEYTLNLKY